MEKQTFFLFGPLFVCNLTTHYVVKEVDGVEWCLNLVRGCMEGTEGERERSRSGSPMEPDQGQEVSELEKIV